MPGCLFDLLQQSGIRLKGHVNPIQSSQFFQYAFCDHSKNYQIDGKEHGAQGKPFDVASNDQRNHRTCTKRSHDPRNEPIHERKGRDLLPILYIMCRLGIVFPQFAVGFKFQRPKTVFCQFLNSNLSFLDQFYVQIRCQQGMRQSLFP